VRVAPEGSILDLSAPTKVPPQIVWEFLSTPRPGGVLSGLQSLEVVG
jgi:hypothetical protein